MKEIKLEVFDAKKEKDLIESLVSLNEGERIKFVSKEGHLICERVGYEIMMAHADSFSLNGKAIRRFTKILETASKKLKGLKNTSIN